MFHAAFVSHPAASPSELVPDWSQLQCAKIKQAAEEYCLSIQDAELQLSERTDQVPQMSLKVRVSKILKINFMDKYSPMESFKRRNRRMEG